MPASTATERDNKKLVRFWFEEVWNKGRAEVIEQLSAQDMPATGLAEGNVKIAGHEQFRTFYTNLRGTLPDIHVKIEDIIAEDDKVAVRLSVEGTHMGNALAPATGQKVIFEALVMARIADGKIVEAWNSIDQLGILRQIGALPADRDRFMKQ